MATNERDDYESDTAETAQPVESPALAPEAEPDTDGADDVTDESTPSVVQPSNPPVARPETLRWASAAVVAAFGLGTLVFLLRAFVTDDTARDHAQAATFGVGVVGLALLCLHLLDRRISTTSTGSGDGDREQVGILRPLISDGRFSTSLTQLGLWTVAAGTGFAYLLGLTIFSSAKLEVVMPDRIWDDYLILLGGPFAAAVLAKGITTYKIENGTMQATTPDVTRPSQVATNEQGHVDLVDAQYLLFNVVALGYFVVKLIESNTLPAMPGALLAVTSSTAGLYVANKAAFRNRPTITSVAPIAVKPGKALVIHGANFMPDGSVEGRVVTVTLSGHTGVIYPLRSSDTMVRVRVPADTTPGWQSVVVTSTAGVATTDFSVHVTAGAQPAEDMLVRT